MLGAIGDCHLGRWLASDAKRLIGDEEARSLLEQIHEDLHTRLMLIERQRLRAEPDALRRSWQHARAVNRHFVETLRAAVQASLPGLAD